MKKLGVQLTNDDGSGGFSCSTKNMIVVHEAVSTCVPSGVRDWH
jgi:hypothetical protein